MAMAEGGEEPGVAGVKPRQPSLRCEMTRKLDDGAVLLGVAGFGVKVQGARGRRAVVPTPVGGIAE